MKNEHIALAVWWTGHLFKSHTGTHSDLQGCIWWRGRLRREENGTEQSGQGAWWGALHLSKMASVAMQLGTKAIYTPAPLSPFFPPQAQLGPLSFRASWITPLYIYPSRCEGHKSLSVLQGSGSVETTLLLTWKEGCFFLFWSAFLDRYACTVKWICDMVLETEKILDGGKF